MVHGSGADAPHLRSRTVVIPKAPPSSLLPNRSQRRGGWHARVAAAREMREMSNHYARQALFEDRDQDIVPYRGRVVVDVSIGWPPRRKTVDFDAAVSCLKPLLDGLTDAGWWMDDRQVVGMSVRQARSLTVTGHVAITVREGGDIDAREEDAEEGKDVPELR